MADAYQIWLDELEIERNTAKVQGLTECQRCGWCCAKKTCVPTPDELPTIAEYLGLSVEEMIKTYMVGDTQWGNSGKARYFLRWANTKQYDPEHGAGYFLDSDATYDMGDCVFYDAKERVCKIWPVRPKDAQGQACWLDIDSDNLDFDERDAWKDGDLQKLCPKMDIDERYYEGSSLIFTP